MKKHIVTVTAILFLIAIFSSVSFAGKGNGVGDCTGPIEDGSGSGNGQNNGSGAGDGSGPIHDVIISDTFGPLTGEVVNCEVPGNGIILDDGTTIFGMAPPSYWDSLGVTKPLEGDVITVEGYIVTIDGVDRYIATTVTIGEDVVVLRDDDGTPLWRGQGNN